MKSFVLAVLIAITIIGGGIYSSNKVNSITYELKTLNESITKNVNELDFEKAINNLEKMDDIINSNKGVLGSYMDHNEVDKVKMFIYQLKVYLENEEKTSSLMCINSLNFLYTSIPNDYKLKFENIF